MDENERRDPLRSDWLVASAELIGTALTGCALVIVIIEGAVHVIARDHVVGTGRTASRPRRRVRQDRRERGRVEQQRSRGHAEPRAARRVDDAHIARVVGTVKRRREASAVDLSLAAAVYRRRRSARSGQRVVEFVRPRAWSASISEPGVPNDASVPAL